MKLCHLSDLHVTDGPRLADQAYTLHRIVSDAILMDPDAWLLTGDFAGTSVPHRSTPAERGVLYPELVRMAEVAPVVVLYGNHDYDPDLDVVAHLAGEWPIRVVKTYESFTVHTLAGPLHLYALPYPTKARLLAGETVPRGLEESRLFVEAKLSELIRVWSAQIRMRRQAAPTEPHVLLAHAQVGGSVLAGGEVLAGNEIELRRNDLDGMPVDYGALGHYHLRQEPADRCWYPGSTWRNGFGETDAKGWHFVHIVTQPGPLRARTSRAEDFRLYPAVPGDRLAATVERRDSGARDFVTLDYRWAAPQNDDPDAAAGWMEYPDPAAFELIRRTQAEVRMRLVVPEQWVAGCPWQAERANVEQLGAVRIQVEKKIEPTLRVRAPGVAAATTDPDKVRAYWKTLATPPTEAEQTAALACLEELSTMLDADVAAETARLTSTAAPVRASA